MCNSYSYTPDRRAIIYPCETRLTGNTYPNDGVVDLSERVGLTNMLAHTLLLPSPTG